jgi:lactate dehydrogenase-like 2-hydroxyacid dehydrogenase
MYQCLCFEIHLGPQLKVVATMSVGYDHIDVDAVKSRNIKLGYTPDVLTDATADLTVLLALGASRRIKESIRAAEDGSVKINKYSKLLEFSFLTKQYIVG